MRQLFIELDAQSTDGMMDEDQLDKLTGFGLAVIDRYLPFEQRLK